MFVFFTIAVPSPTPSFNPLREMWQKEGKSIWEITQVCKFSTLVHLLFRHRFRLSLTNILHVCARYYQKLVERCSIG